LHPIANTHTHDFFIFCFVLFRSWGCTNMINHPWVAPPRSRHHPRLGKMLVLLVNVYGSHTSFYHNPQGTILVLLVNIYGNNIISYQPKIRPLITSTQNVRTQKSFVNMTFRSINGQIVRPPEVITQQPRNGGHSVIVQNYDTLQSASKVCDTASLIPAQFPRIISSFSGS
jgi:hypothetical protein